MDLNEFAKSIIEPASKSRSELVRENKKLRAELEELYGQNIYPASDFSDPCRKCGQCASQKIMVQAEGKLELELVAEGPSKRFEPAVRKCWYRPWIKAVPERMRCECFVCKAVYYELVDVRKIKIKRVRSGSCIS